MNWPAYLSYVSVSVFTPGPNNLASLAVAARCGFWSSLKLRCGMSSAFALITAVVVLGGKFLVEHIPSARPVLTAFGAAYILWMAWKTLNSHTGDGSDLENSYLSGVLLCLVNVKSILFIVTSIAAWVIPTAQNGLQTFIYAGILPLFAFISQNIWAAAGTALNRVMRAHERAVNIILAALLVWCAWTVAH